MDAGNQQVHSIFGSTALRAINPNDLKARTEKDEMLTRVMYYLRNKWPSRCAIDIDRAFFKVRSELTTLTDCIYKGNRAVIPASLRSRILNLAHEGHSAIVKTKQCCRECVWWPSIDKHIEHYIFECVSCVISNKQ